MKLDIYQTLEKLKGKQPIERIQAKYIYQDEQTNEIKERPLESAGSAYINSAESIHKFMFGR